MSESRRQVEKKLRVKGREELRDYLGLSAGGLCVFWRIEGDQAVKDTVGWLDGQE